MLLSDNEIQRELREGGLVVLPLLHPRDIQPASIDLTLHPKLLVAEEQAPGVIVEYTWDLNTQGQFSITRRHFVLGATQEHFEIGNHLAGEIVGKSTLARLGLVVEAAGYFDPGWKGRGTLELSDRSPFPVVLKSGMRICQLRLHPVAGEVLRPYGSEGLGSHYQGSDGPVPAYSAHPD